MKKRMLKTGIVALIMSTMLIGCGSSKTDMQAATTEAASSYEPSNDIYVNSSAGADVSDYGVYEDAMPEEVAEEVAEEPVESESGSTTQSLESVSGRKLIRNVSLEVETEQFDELMAQLEDKIKALGGYIEQSYTYNGRSYADGDMKNADLTIRIPAEKLDVFLSAVSEQSNVTSKNENVTDVTLQYVDLESHKKALLAEQDRLLEMIEQAETIEDMITIESRLSDVRYQLESQEAQLRTYDNQIQYSTVYLNISEVTKYTPPAERTFFQKISEGFADSLVGVATDLTNFLIWFITSLPYLVVWGIIIAVVVRIILKSRRNKKERMERGIDRKTQKAEQKALKQQKKLEKKAKKQKTDEVPAKKQEVQNQDDSESK